MASRRHAPETAALGRRQFFSWAGKRGMGLGLAAVSLPAFVAACAREEDPEAAATPLGTPPPEGRAIVGDVLDYALTSAEWTGAFGYVTFRLRRGVVDGQDVYYIRTDASDEAFAQREQLVWVPRIAGLVAAGATADAFLVSGGVADQATVLSTEPGRDDYTPAFRIHEASWTTTPRELTSVDEVRSAEQAGDLEVSETNTVVNASLVKWSTGEMPADDERTEYIGPGQLLEPPDTDAMEVRFKLHECFPNSWYIVTDTSMGPMAEGMSVAHSPRLLEAQAPDGTGRTNVFMNGLEGPGPMGAQPSVFDSAAGDAQWSPYWDHMTYAWANGVTPRVLRTEAELLAARDQGELEEFPGTPDTEGEVFVVNCPVPVLAPNTFDA